MGTISIIQTNGVSHYIASTAYCYCSTAAGTSAKVANVIGDQSDSASTAAFTLIKGTTVHVRFVNSNTVDGPTLNVGGTGAKEIRLYGNEIADNNEPKSWRAGAIVEFTYDGTYWRMNSGWDDNTTYLHGTPSEGSSTVCLVARKEKYEWNHGIIKLADDIAYTEASDLRIDHTAGEHITYDNSYYRFNSNVASGSSVSTNISNGNIQKTTVGDELKSLCNIIKTTTSVTSLTNTLCTWRYREFVNGYIDGYGIIHATWSHYTTASGFYGYSATVNLPVTFGGLGVMAEVSWNIGSAWGISAGVKGVRTSNMMIYAWTNVSGAQDIYAMIHIQGLKA